jgi:hypothetical protein
MLVGSGLLRPSASLSVTGEIEMKKLFLATSAMLVCITAANAQIIIGEDHDRGEHHDRGRSESQGWLPYHHHDHDRDRHHRHHHDYDTEGNF